jgi:acetyltransferase-like isoleucine patch superfamily enzyme
MRFIGLYLYYLLRKIQDRAKIKYNGFTIIYAFRMSRIHLGNNIIINSSPLSNLLGLYQRTIIIARYGGQISIGNNCGKLGDNCVVGAGSVVCGTFPDNVIIAGNPAKVIRQND